MTTQKEASVSPIGSRFGGEADRLQRSTCCAAILVDTTDQSTHWRLRYAAFLCAVFDVFLENIRTGVPFEFAKKL